MSTQSKSDPFALMLAFNPMLMSARIMTEMMTSTTAEPEDALGTQMVEDNRITVTAWPGSVVIVQPGQGTPHVGQLFDIWRPFFPHIPW